MKEVALHNVAMDAVPHALVLALGVPQIPHVLHAPLHVKEDAIHLAPQPVKVLLQTTGVQIVQIVVLLDVREPVQELVQEGVVPVVQKNAVHHVHRLVQVVAGLDVQAVAPAVVEQVVLVDVVEVADLDVPAAVLATAILAVLVDVVVHAQADVHLPVQVAQEHVQEHVSFIVTRHAKAVVVQLAQHIVAGPPVWVLVWVLAEVG